MSNIVHDPERRHGLLTFLSQIKPEDDERDYLVDQLSHCLSGRIKKQLVHILAGPMAGNGESTLFSLILHALGDYFCTMDITYLTQKSAQANNANPIIIDVKRARRVGMSEPEEGARFNGAILKALSGGDEQKGRALFNNKLIRYHPQLRMFILCNDTSDVDGKDRGLARQIRKINFASQFTDIKQPDLQNRIYPINVDMSDMLRVWAPKLMVLLLERFSPDYVYSCPSSIQQGSEEYMQEIDPVRRFVQDNLQKDVKSVVTSPDLRELQWDFEEYCMQIGFLEVHFLSPCVCPSCAMAGTTKAVFTISLYNERHNSGCTVAGARPKQALAYPTQHSFLSQMWRILVA